MTQPQYKRQSDLNDALLSTFNKFISENPDTKAETVWNAFKDTMNDVAHILEAVK